MRFKKGEGIRKSQNPVNVIFRSPLRTEQAQRRRERERERRSREGEGMQRFFTANDDDDDRRAFVGGFLWPRPQPASPRLSFRFARDKFVVGKKGGEDMGGKFESSLSFLFEMELNEFHDCRLS